MGKPRNTQKYPTYLEIPEIPEIPESKKDTWKYPIVSRGRRLMANTILNFHFDYLHTSHRQTKNTKSREGMDLTPPPTFSSNLILWTKVLNAGVQEIRSVSLVRTCKPLWISLMHPSLPALHYWHLLHILLLISGKAGCQIIKMEV